MHPLKTRAMSLLRKSEKYTKTDMVYAASGGFWVSIAQVSAVVFSIPLSIAFAHLLTQNEYGIYKYALSVAAIVGVFSLTGISTAVSRSAARGFDGVLMQAFWLSLRTSALSIVVALALAGYYAFNANMVLATCLLIIAVLSPLFNSAYLFSSFLLGKGDFKLATKYNTLRNLFGSVSVLLAVFFFPDPVAILLIYFLAYTISGLFFIYLTRRSLAKDGPRDPELGAFSLHLSFINALSVFADKIDSILLFQTVGAAELAIYSFAEIIPDAINRFTKNVGTLAFPKYALQKKPTGIVRKSILLSLLFIPVVVAYIVAAPYIFGFFFPTYMSAVPFTQVLSVFILFSGVLPGTYIDAQKAIKRRYLINIVNNSVKITLTVGGVLLFGLWGAVIARVASKALNTSFTLLVCKWRWD